MTSVYQRQSRAHAARATVVSAGLGAAVSIVTTAEHAAAQLETEAVRDRPGTVGLLVATLLLVTWAVAFGIALTRARTRQTRRPESGSPV